MMILQTIELEWNNDFTNHNMKNESNNLENNYPKKSQSETLHEL
jgi:hypothetical protein